MLIRSWLTYQGPSIRQTLVNRVSNTKKGKRADDLLAPYRMNKVSVATHLDEDFGRFAARLPKRLAADAMLVRILRFAADRSPIMGEIVVPRDRWGAVVLRTDQGDVSKADGEAVFDAAVAERILIESTPETRLQRTKDVLAIVRHDVVLDASGCVIGYVSRDASEGESASGTPPPALAPAPATATPRTPPPSAGSSRGTTAGATASASPLTASEVAGLRAMAGVFRLKANGHPDAEAARARKLMDELAAGTADSAEARAWRDMRFAITDARVAYLAAYAGSPKAEEA